VIVLLLVFIATATLFVWLLVELGRLMLRADRGDMAVDRLVHGVAGGVRGAAGRFGGATGSGGHRVEAPRAPVGTSGDGAVTGGEAGANQSWVRHDMEVEELVRERLYGGRSRGSGAADGGGARGGAAGTDREPTRE
jgi:hypothetical protein